LTENVCKIACGGFWDEVLKGSWSSWKIESERICYKRIFKKSCYSKNVTANRKYQSANRQIQKRIANIRRRIANIQKLIANFRKRIANIQKRIANFRKRIANVQKRIGNIQKRIACLYKRVVLPALHLNYYVKLSKPENISWHLCTFTTESKKHTKGIDLIPFKLKDYSERNDKHLRVWKWKSGKKIPVAIRVHPKFEFSSKKLKEKKTHSNLILYSFHFLL
jgi:DNA repair exonuclease SbcCD ATPase subunit